MTLIYTLCIVIPMTGEELRQIRKQMGLTQVEFAALVSLTPNTIARQERGEVAIRESLAKLIRLLANQNSQAKKTQESER